MPTHKPTKVINKLLGIITKFTIKFIYVKIKFKKLNILEKKVETDGKTVEIAENIGDKKRSAIKFKILKTTLISNCAIVLYLLHHETFNNSVFSI